MANNVNKQRADGRIWEASSSRSCRCNWSCSCSWSWSWSWSWVTAIGMKLRKERGTMRQRNLNAQCELYSAGRTGCGSALWFGFIFMRRVFFSHSARFLFSIFSSLFPLFFLAFCPFLCAYCICLDSFGSHKNKLPEVCKCMMQLIRYCLKAWICHANWLQLWKDMTGQGRGSGGSREG